MGVLCCRSQTSPGLSLEETLAEQGLKAFGVPRLPCPEILRSVSLLAEGEQVPPAALPAWLQSIGLDVPELSNQQSSVAQCFAALSGKGGIAKQVLCSLGILLGKATTEQKTDLLFDSFEDKGFVGPSELVALFSVLAQIAQALALLGLGKGHDARVREYFETLGAGVEGFVSASQVSFCKESTVIHRATFAEHVRHMPALLTPRLTRSQLLKHSRGLSETQLPAPPPKEPVKLTCINQHELSWDNLVAHTHFSIHETWLVPCANCQKTFSRAGWYCEDCSYYICEACGTKADAPSQRLCCSQGHSLLLRFDVALSGRQCRSCAAEVTGAGWHCRRCEFDRCTNCAEAEGYSLLENELMCDNQHRLERQAARARVSQDYERCDACQVEIDDWSMACPECSYYLCENCADYYSAPVADHPCFQCCEGHLFHWLNPAKRYGTDTYQCVGCLQLRAGPTFHCADCCVELCGLCGAKLAEFVTEATARNCGNGHELEWSNTWAEKSYDCSKCAKTYRQIGAFHCRSCQVSLCFNCLEEPDTN